MTLGDRIRLAREAAGHSQASLARKLGTAQTTISKWERNASEPGRDDIKRLAQALRIPVSVIEDIPSTGETKRTLPVMGYVGAGQFIEPLDSDFSIDEIIAPPMAPIEAQAAIIRGSSMAPAYRDGNVVIWWKWYEDPRPILGIPSICRLTNDSMALKMIEPGSAPHLWTLHSINPSVSPIRDVELAGASPIEITLRCYDWL